MPTAIQSAPAAQQQTLAGDYEATADFVLKILPTERVHITLIHPDRPNDLVGKTFPKEEVSRAVIIKFLSDHQARGYNGYYTGNDITCTLGPDRKKPKKEHVSRALYLHSDLDMPDGMSIDMLPNMKTRLLNRVTKMPRPPHIAIDTGGGIQTLSFINPIEVNADNLTKIEDRNKQLAADQARDIAKGDKCQNIERLLRLPGTINFPDKGKRDKGRVPVLTKIVHLSDRMFFDLEGPYDLTEFPAAPTASTKSTRAAPSVSTSGDAPSITPSNATAASLGTALKQKLQDKITQQIAAGTDRSAHAFGIVCALIRARISDEDIIALMIDPANLGFAHIHDPQRAPRGPKRTAERMLHQALQAQPRAGVGVIDSFIALLTEHVYINEVTRQRYPAASVNGLYGSGTSAFFDTTNGVLQETWFPGKPMVIENFRVTEQGLIPEPGVNIYNSYEEPHIKPTEGKSFAELELAAKPWIDLNKKLWGDKHATAVTKRFAHCAQRPHIKINHQMVWGSRAGGIGKDSLLEPIKYAVGFANFKEATPEQMMDKFNPFLKAVVLRVSEAKDLGEFNKKDLYNHTKTFAAAPPYTLPVQDKNIRLHSIFNLVFIIWTTNDEDALFMESDSRRHFVLWSDVTPEDFGDTPEKREKFWTDYHKWLEDGGNEAVAQYLMAYDISDFNPKAPPEKTAAFRAMCHRHSSPEVDELRSVLDAMDWPNVLTIDHVAKAARTGEFNKIVKLFEDDARVRSVPHRLGDVGYISVHNPETKDGRWRVAGRRVAVYARKEGTTDAERQEAASEYVKNYQPKPPAAEDDRADL